MALHKIYFKWVELSFKDVLLSLLYHNRTKLVLNRAHIIIIFVIFSVGILMGITGFFYQIMVNINSIKISYLDIPFEGIIATTLFQRGTAYSRGSELHPHGKKPINWLRCSQGSPLISQGGSQLCLCQKNYVKCLPCPSCVMKFLL